MVEYMNTEKRIIKLLEQRDRSKIMLQRQIALRELCSIYGIRCVSIASGWTESTIKQYLSAKHPSIGLEQLLQAEEIFKQL